MIQVLAEERLKKESKVSQHTSAAGPEHPRRPTNTPAEASSHTISTGA
ncbi:hypothetical protein [Streptomyces sp. H27-S2]|nr:hypothetical protein [Streptomyces sp. H27-S2]MCY0949883.1 hypothetical protein [Streptomyces sp. H27-S2]